MSITLDAITLPSDLIWTDEFDWSPMQQSEAYTLTGALVLETGLKLKGRPITLASGETVWIDRQTLVALYAKLSSSAVMVLTLNDARTFNVVFRNGQQPLQAAPVVDYATPDNADFYTLSIQLMQV